MKIIWFLFLIVIMFLSCSTETGKKIIIRDHIKMCTTDLIESQLKDNIRKKEYDFEGQKFTLYIDTSGKPVFLVDDRYHLSIDLKLNDNYYSVSLNNGIIRVENN